MEAPMNTTKPKYYFCWWCSRQLWAKRLHISMRATEAANENTTITVTVHRECSRAMELEGWVQVEAMQADAKGDRSGARTVPDDRGEDRVA